MPSGPACTIDFNDSEFDAAIRGHGVEQPTVMTHQEQGSVESPEGLFQLFDRSQVEMVGGFVQYEAVDAGGHQPGELRAAALAGGEFHTGAMNIVGTETELREQ